MKKTNSWKILLLLLALGVSSGCLTVKLNGFQEIAEGNPMGLENAVSTDEGAAFVRDLGRYINQLEQQLERGD
jgi:hypothetical protein